MGLAVTASPVGKNQAAARLPALALVRLVTPVKLWRMSWPNAGQSERPTPGPAAPARRGRRTAIVMSAAAAASARRACRGRGAPIFVLEPLTVAAPGTAC